MYDLFCFPVQRGKRCTSARESIILCIVDMKGSVTCAAGEVVKQPGEDCAIVQLSDGLGNQLFQYAFALALSRQAGHPVMLDVSWFPEFGGRLRKATPRRFGLGVYQLSLPYVVPGTPDCMVYGTGFLGWLRKKLHRRRNYLRERDADLSLEKLSSLPVPVVLRGFYQKACYAESVRADLLREYALDEAGLNAANAEMLAAIRAAGPRAVMVHIRRGDYLNPNVAAVHGSCGAEYYQKAEALLEEQLGGPLHLFVFSDDPEWVLANYRTRNEMTPVAVNGPDDAHLDINLMRHCAHAIIANSTFSWWGAWLIDGPGKQVVAPASWFADGRQVEGLLPREWVVM